MDFELANLAPQRLQTERERSVWPQRTLPELLAERAARSPDAVAVEDGTRSLTFAALQAQVQAAADGLRRRGVAPGDVVAWQLPTSIDAVLLQYATAYAGAVSSPISLLHREHDLRHMLGLARPPLVVCRPELRGVPFARMLHGVVQEVGLQSEVVAAEDGQLAGLLGGEASAAPAPPTDPNAPLYIVWTSGTTSEPKGVVHTHNTGLCGLALKLERIAVGEGDAMLVIAPITHHIGIYAMHMIALAGIRLALMESWQADRGVQMIAQTRPTFTAATPTFLVDLIRCETLAQHDVSSLRLFSVSGAPIAPAVVEQAQQKLPGCAVVSSYGTSEDGYITSAGPEHPPELSAASDGFPLRYVEVRVLGPERQVLGPGDEGDLVVRSPAQYAGYARRPELTRSDLDAEGFRWTGDRALLRPDGTIRLTGRSKDIIIRGGQNVPVVQVENALLRHPAVGSVAVVAMPDERLGEKACAYVVPRTAETRLTLDDLRTVLAEQGIARTYWPERLELIEQLPTTASGKIQKYRLREMIAARLRDEQAASA